VSKVLYEVRDDIAYITLNRPEVHNAIDGETDKLLFQAWSTFATNPAARLAILTNAERREVRGLHPDRAPTIVAGIVILLETVRAFGLDELEVSEHDILVGAALDAVLGRAGTG